MDTVTTTDAAAAPASAPVIDLGSLKFDETDTMTVKHPVTGDNLPWTVTLAGPSHQRTLELAERQTRRAFRKEQERNRRGAKAAEPDAAERRMEIAEDFAARILDWTPVNLNGTLMTYSRENAVKLLADPAYGWFLSQLVEFMLGDTSFLQGSASA